MVMDNLKKTRAVLGFRGFGFRGVWNMLSFGMVVLDMSWLVFMYAVKKKRICPEPLRSISAVACASFWLVENYGHLLVE